MLQLSVWPKELLKPGSNTIVLSMESIAVLVFAVYILLSLLSNLIASHSG